jgi:replicative DNA helicase
MCPVHNIELEQQLLGAILMNNDAYAVVAGVMSADYFYEPLHQEIYSAIGSAIASGMVASIVTLKSFVPAVTINGRTISQYLAHLVAESTTVLNAPDFARQIRQLWELRQVAAVGSLAAIAGYSPAETLERVWGELDAIRSEATVQHGARGSIGVLARELADDIANPNEKEAVYSTGFQDLDRFIGGGYRPKRLYVVAGRPGMGKSVYGIASARRVANKGIGVAFFSLELDTTEMSARVLASHMALGHAPTDYADILTKRLTPAQRSGVIQAAGSIKELPLEVDTTGGLTMFDVGLRAQRYIDRWSKRGIEPGIIVIDYMGLVRASDRYRGNKVHEQGEIALAGKELSKKLGVGVLLLAQLNRGVEQRDDKRPQMSDLRDSGNIEEHADVVALLYRPAYYDQKDPKVREGDAEALDRANARRNDLEVGLGKNRLGPTAGVTLWCNVGQCAVDNARGQQ